MDENDYKVAISLRAFWRLLKKRDTPESFIVIFSPHKLAQLFLLKEVKPFPNSKMIKILKSDNLLPPPRHSHKKPLQDDDAFFAKMTLVHARSFALRKSRPRRLSKKPGHER